MTVDDRVNILQRLEAGELAVNLAKEYHVSQSAISGIKKRQENIFKVKNILENCEGNTKKKRFKGTEDTALEQKLYLWITEQRNMGLQITGPMLKKQALLFNENLGGSDNFKASNGWLDLFKKRHGLKYLSVQSQNSSVIRKSNEKTQEKIAEIISATGIGPEYIYSCTDIGLYWKTIPHKFNVKKSMKKTERKKIPSNRVTIMLCSNALGTHKLTLFIVGKSAQPRCLEAVKYLPVVYHHQINACMDNEMMKKWYTSVFIPEIKEKHDLNHNKNTKIILIMDNVFYHHFEDELSSISPSCTTFFLSSNVKSSIEPLDQGITELFKKCYRNILLLAILAKNYSQNGEDFLNSYNLLDCFNFCSLAWNEITLDNIRRCWSHIIPTESRSTCNIQEVDVIALHSLVVQIPGLNELTFQDTKNWLNVDSDRIGWEDYADDDLISNQCSDEMMDNSIEELDDQVENDDEDLLVPEDKCNSNTRISSGEALNALRTYLQWYETCEGASPSTIQTLHEANLFTIKKICEESTITH